MKKLHVDTLIHVCLLMTVVWQILCLLVGPTNLKFPKSWYLNHECCPGEYVTEISPSQDQHEEGLHAAV